LSGSSGCRCSASSRRGRWGRPAWPRPWGQRCSSRCAHMRRNSTSTWTGTRSEVSRLASNCGFCEITWGNLPPGP
jgi:hypothetical protein